MAIVSEWTEISEATLGIEKLLLGEVYLYR